MAGIYLHIPFCIHKCFYCDFYSIGKKAVSNDFIDAICNEIKLRANCSDWKDLKFNTVYFGGGTPSLMTPEQTEKIVSSLYRYYCINEEAELTIECNPGSAELQFLKEYRKLGFNRLSLGVQSFNAEELIFLERVHSADEAQSAYNKAQESGFDNIGIDLIFGIPGQTIQTWNISLERAINIYPKHLSVYNLTYEMGTPLYIAQEKGKVIKADEGIEEEMFYIAHNKLVNAGYLHYEISNYCLPGFQSKHNSNYWNHSKYLALGPSAHGFTGKERYWNIASLNKYIKLCLSEELPESGREQISDEDKINEIIMLGLRALNLDLSQLNNLIDSKNSQDILKYLRILENNKILVIENDIVRLTQSGMLLSNEIAAKIASFIS